MKGHGAKLPRKQEAAIGALLSSRNIEEAAKTTGVSASTLRRWMRLPEFESDYLRARREGVTQAYARLQQNSNVAGTLLLKLLVGSKDSTKLQAAKCILELSRKALDTEDILLRLERLEEHVKSKT
jgi:transposase-like protein